MSHCNTIFSQILKLVSRHEFETLAKRYLQSVLSVLHPGLQYCFDRAKFAVLCAESQTIAPLIAIKDFHIKKFILRPAGKLIGNLKICSLKFLGHNPATRDMTIARSLDTIKYFHFSMAPKRISTTLMSESKDWITLWKLCGINLNSSVEVT